MFDFHAHGGKRDCNAFVSYSADEYQEGKRNRYMSLMYLPWIDTYDVRTYIDILFSDDNLMAGEIGLDSRFKDRDQSAFYTILEALEGTGCCFSIKQSFLSKKNWKEYLSLPFLLETDMKTGKEQEERICSLYSKIEAESGIDVYSLMEERKKELFDD